MRSNRVAFATLTALLVLSTACSDPVDPAPDPTPAESTWKAYATPEDAGWSSALLEAAWQEADANGSGAVMVVQGDAVVAAWGDISRKFRAHSIRKMLLSALYGIAVEEGLIDISATLEQLNIDDISLLSAQEKSATVEQLLMSASGIYLPAVSQDDTPPLRHSQAPGAVFWYNNWDFNTLGRIYDQLTGQSLFVALHNRIGQALDMEDFQLADTFYEFERRKTIAPAYHLRMSARDMARFGLMMMRGGKWKGEQIIPADWVATSTRAHISAGANRSFGYMWWILEAGFFTDHPSVEAVLASGTGGQRILFFPALDVVIVHRGDTDYARGAPVTWPLVNSILTARTGQPDDTAPLGEVEVRPFSQPPPPLALPVRTVVADAVLDRYVGKYETLAGPDLPAGIEAFVGRREDFLVLYIPVVELESDFFPETETTFFPGLQVSRMRFGMSGDAVTGLTITIPGTGEVIEALRVP